MFLCFWKMWIAQRLNSNWLSGEVFFCYFCFFFFLSFDIIEIDLGFRCGLHRGWTRTGCLVRSPETGSPRGRWANPPKGAKENVREKPFFGFTSFKEAVSFVPLLMKMMKWFNTFVHLLSYASLAIILDQIHFFVQCEEQKDIYEDYIPISFYGLFKNIKYCPWLLSAECFQIKVIVFAERIFQKSSDKLWHSGENPQTASNLSIRAQMGNIICIIEESQIVVTLFSHDKWKGLHQKPFINVWWCIFVNLSIPFPKDCVNLSCLIVCLFVCSSRFHDMCFSLQFFNSSFPYYPSLSLPLFNQRIIFRKITGV